MNFNLVRRRRGGEPGRLARTAASTGVALSVAGACNGMTEPNIGARSHDIQHRIGLTDRGLSLGWAGWPAGMLLASMVAGRIMERIGARRLMQIGAVLYWGGFGLIGQVTQPWSLFVGMFVTGLGNGFFDVAWNRLSAHHDDESQKEESAGFVLAMLNAAFSFGSLGAALMGMAVTALRVSLAWHLGLVGGLALVTVLAISRALPDLRSPVSTEGGSSVPGRLRLVAVVGCCQAVPVGVGYLWSDVYLHRLGASSVMSTVGLVSFTAFEAVFRSLVGQLSKRYAWLSDGRRLTFWGGVMALGGMALIVGPATVPAAILGFGLLAGGMSPAAAVVSRLAPQLWPDRKDRAQALTTRYMYVALTLGPVVIGPLSTAFGSADSAVPLRIALSCLAVLPLIVMALARYMRTPD